VEAYYDPAFLIESLVVQFLVRIYVVVVVVVVVVGCWLLVVGYWLLVVGCWLLVVGCWLLVVVVALEKTELINLNYSANSYLI
jgi:hypothetical protein